MYPEDFDPLKKERRVKYLYGRGYCNSNVLFMECRDAILHAFKKLRSQNIRTRANFWCCGSCACSAITILDEERKKKGQKPFDGAVYWHRQAEEGLRETGSVYVYFCVDAKEGIDHKPNAKAVAEKLVAALKAEDLDVTWDGDTGTAVLVDGFTEKYWEDQKNKSEFREAVDNAYGIKLG